MRLKCINIVTTCLAEMCGFYARVLQAPCTEIGPGRFEITVQGVTLVFTHTSVKTPVNPDSCGLEFEVENVDEEYKRLIGEGVPIDSPPVTYPWKARAIGFRDPDGNHIDFVQFVQ